MAFITILVVIAIIAILAAMLLPALSAARERARSSNCISNLKQCALSMLMYVNDNDDWVCLGERRPKHGDYPAKFLVELGYTPTTSKVNTTYDYFTLKGTALRCPSLPVSDEDDKASPHAYAYGTRTYQHGYYNNSASSFTDYLEKIGGAFLGTFHEGRAAASSLIHMGRINVPEDFSLFIDSKYTATGKQYGCLTRPQDAGTAGAVVPDLRHGTIGNSAFLDGSARSFTKEGLRDIGFAHYTEGSSNTIKAVP